MRSGSTWLQTMLAQLSDVVADYELKWKPNFDLEEIHVPIYNCKFMLDEFFENMPNFPIKGTKLTFDFAMIEEEYYEIVNWLPSNVGIIHLTRNYYDILNSYYRGIFHNYKTSNSLKHKSPVIHKALLRSKNDYSNVVSIPIIERKRFIDTNEAKNQLNVFLSVDRCAYKLSLRNPYLRIDYSKITLDFKKIIKFIGSTENNERIKKILENPLAIRLPNEQVIINKRRIRKISNYFEKKRDKAIQK